MSTLNVANVTDGTTSVPTGYVVNGSAKIWVNFQGTGTISIIDSFNGSSLSDIGTGNYRVYYSTNMADADYCILTAGAGLTAGSGADGKNISSYTEFNSTSGAGISAFSASGSSYIDVSRVFVHVTGDLA